MEGRRLTAIYLQDHVAVLAGGEDLVRRTLGETQLLELRRLLDDVLPGAPQPMRFRAGRT